MVISRKLSHLQTSYQVLSYSTPYKPTGNIFFVNHVYIFQVRSWVSLREKSLKNVVHPRLITETIRKINNHIWTAEVSFIRVTQDFNNENHC